MREHDPLIGSYEHLDKLPRAPEALHNLQKIASLVKPIMRNHNWRIGTFAEFFPDQANLLGMNYGNGRKIYVRLRHAGDQRQFLPLEHVVDTFLHELSHNVHGPHNAEFHALWNKLRDDYDDLKMKGYTGEGFLSEGHRVGGQRVPVHEMRRQARIQAEKRRAQQKGSGQRLGGQAVPRGSDMRAVIADAVSRRTSITQGCGAGTREGEKAAEQASRNGFRTKAEEDDANERAIAQAMWELVQEDEARKAGVTMEQGWQSEGIVWNPGTGLDFAPQPNQPLPSARPTSYQPPPHPPPSQQQQQQRRHSTQHRPSIPKHSKPTPSSASTPAQAAPPAAQQKQTKPETNPRTGKPISRLVTAAASTKPTSNPSTNQTTKKRPRQPSSSTDTAVPTPPTPTAPTNSWTCPICTLWNPSSYLICDACGLERPSSSCAGPPSTWDFPPPEEPPANPSSSASRGGERLGLGLGWNCRSCGAFMETRWWTCSACGLMKEAS